MTTPIEQKSGSASSAPHVGPHPGMHQGVSSGPLGSVGQLSFGLMQTFLEGWMTMSKVASAGLEQAEYLTRAALDQGRVAREQMMALQGELLELTSRTQGQLLKMGQTAFDGGPSSFVEAQKRALQELRVNMGRFAQAVSSSATERPEDARH